MKRFWNYINKLSNKDSFYMGVIVSSLIIFIFVITHVIVTEILIDSYEKTNDKLMDLIESCEFKIDGQKYPCFIKTDEIDKLIIETKEHQF